MKNTDIIETKKTDVKGIVLPEPKKEDSNEIYTPEDKENLDCSINIRSNILKTLAAKKVEDMDSKEIRLILDTADSLDNSIHKKAENKSRLKKDEESNLDKDHLAGIIGSVATRAFQKGMETNNSNILSDNYVPKEEDLVVGELSNVSRVKEDLDTIIENVESKEK